MTLLQALEHTRWDLKLDSVLTRGEPFYGREPCPVCDAEFCGRDFAVFKDPRTYDSFYVDLGNLCAWDLKVAIETEKKRARQLRRDRKG